MKRVYLFLLGIIASLAVGCGDIYNQDVTIAPTGKSYDNLTASFDEADTRVYLESDLSLSWHSGDLISVFYGNNYNNTFTFDGKTGDKSGEFALQGNGGEGATTLERIYALYPYQTTAAISEHGIIAFNMPATQSYAERSFPRDGNIMVAATSSRTDGKLSFRNAVGYFKLKLYGEGTVKSIVVKGNDNEKIAGAATLTATYNGIPTVAMSSDATTSITLDCGEGVALGSDKSSATEFIMAIPEVTFNDGISITVTDTQGNTFTKTTKNAVAIERNYIKPMAALLVEFASATPKPASNEIWYTTTDGQQLSINASRFSASILNQTLREDGVWVITFDKELTQLGVTGSWNGAFESQKTLTSVVLPDSITRIEPYTFYGCSALESVTLPANLEFIGGQAFYNNTKLQSIDLPASLTEIGYKAFDGCNSLTEVKVHATTPPTLGQYIFSRYINLYVPEGTINAYKSSSWWNYINEIEEFVDEEPTTPEEEPVFQIDANGNYVVEAVGGNIEVMVTTNLQYSVSIPTAAQSWISHTATRAVRNETVVLSIAQNQSAEERSAVVTLHADNGTTIEVSIIQKGYIEEEEAIFEIGANGEYIVEANGGNVEISVITNTQYSVSIPSAAQAWISHIATRAIRNETIVLSIAQNQSTEERSAVVTLLADNGTTNSVTIIQRGVTAVVPDAGNVIRYTTTDGNKLNLSNNAFNASIASHTKVGDEWIITFNGTVTAINADAFLNQRSLSSIVLPDSITLIDDYAFYSCKNLTDITLPQSLETIGECAIYECAITTLTFPASVKTIEAGVALECPNLSTVISEATTPPSLGDYAFPDSVNVNVPEESLLLYQRDTQWSKYMLNGTIIESGGSGSSGASDYVSTDYSEHGKIVTLQSHKEGAGIPIFIMGDGYSDRQMELYEYDMNRAMEVFFSEEPYTSFRDLFDIYMVKLVSKHEGWVENDEYGDTALNCYFSGSDGRSISGDTGTVYSYVQQVVGENKLDDTLSIVIMNSNVYGGTCHMSQPYYCDKNDYSCGKACCFFPLCGNDQTFAGLLLHEACGHGFAKLGDEYFPETNSEDWITNYYYYLCKDMEQFGWYKNVDVALNGETIDETNVKWKHFINDSRYDNEDVGIYEGSYTFARGAYRSSDNSIMRHNTGGFNAPSREAIYYRIHKLAYGDKWVYNFEDFVTWDAKNRNKTSTAASIYSKSLVITDMPHVSPVIHR